MIVKKNMFVLLHLHVNSFGVFYIPTEGPKAQETCKHLSIECQNTD